MLTCLIWLNFVCLCCSWLTVFLCLNRYFCSRNLKFKLAAVQAIQWQRRNEVLLISLFQITSKSYSSCQAGKELQGVLLPMKNNQNPQGGSSKDVQSQTVAVVCLVQSLEAISGAAWENLSSKWIVATRTRKKIWTNGRSQQNSKSGKLHKLSLQMKIAISSCQFAMEQMHHQCSMQPHFSTRTTWFCLGWIRTAWIALENFLPKWILFFILIFWVMNSTSGRSGHEKKMFCWSIKMLLSLMRHLWDNKLWSVSLLVLPAMTPSTLWPIFWNWRNTVQCAKRDVFFMLSLLVLMPANLLVLCWQPLCFSITVIMQIRFCLAFWAIAIAEFCSLCLLLITHTY